MKTSEQIDQLATALAAAQAEMPSIKKEGKSHHGKYATLEDIIASASPILSKHGLSLVQSPSILSDNRIGMTTRIMHKSGQWLESEQLSSKLARDDAQSVGSCISYLRRYQITPMLFIATTDDDGNAASGMDATTGKSLDKGNDELAKTQKALQTLQNTLKTEREELHKLQAKSNPVFNSHDEKHFNRLQDLLKAESISLDCLDAIIEKIEGMPLTEIKNAILAYKKTL